MWWWRQFDPSPCDVYVDGELNESGERGRNYCGDVGREQSGDWDYEFYANVQRGGECDADGAECFGERSVCFVEWMCVDEWDDVHGDDECEHDRYGEL